MNTIGLIGGTSWESTAVYYRLLNEGVRARLGGLHSAKIALVSVDFAPLAAAMRVDRWDVVTDVLVGAARQLQAAGAECLGLCTNTMHKVAGPLAAATALPFVNIMDVTGAALVAHGCRRPLLLATRYTMEHAFYRDHLQHRFGLVVTTPEKAERDNLQAIIFDELCRGIVTTASKTALLAIIAACTNADSVIFGCTEIGMLLTQADVAQPVLDTTALHCDALLDVALGRHASPESHVP